MSEESDQKPRGGSSRHLVTFLLGVCVGLSLYHAWVSSRDSAPTRLANLEEGPSTSVSPQPQSVENPQPEPEPPTTASDAVPPIAETPAETTEASEAPSAGLGGGGAVESPEGTDAATDPAEATPEAVQESEAAPTQPSHADLAGLWPARHLIVALPGPELDDATRAWLAEFKPGVVLLQHQNLFTEWQTRDLMAEVRATVGLGETRTDLPLFALCQEGGPQANPLGIEDAPAAEALGRDAAVGLAPALDGAEPNANAIDEAVKPIRETAARYGRLAKERGMAIVFAPVLDVFRPNASDPRLRDRTFGTDAVRVHLCGEAFADGLIEGGVIPVVKHYPGLGAANSGPDGALSIAEDDVQALANHIFLPFAMAADRQVPGILVAPVAVPALDRSGKAASLSPRIVGAVLREMWAYTGVVVADELPGMTPAEAFVGALVAGCDAYVLYSPDWNTLRECGAALAKAVVEGTLSEERLEESRARLDAWQERLGGTPTRMDEILLTKADVDATQPPEATSSEESPPGNTEQPEETSQQASEEPADEPAATPPDAEPVKPPPASEIVAAAENAATPTEQPVPPTEDQTPSKTSGPPGAPVEDGEPQDTDGPPAAGVGESAPGEAEILPAEAEAPAPEVQADEPAPPPEPAPQPEGTKHIDHRIKRGETLIEIAQAYGVTADELREWNGMVDSEIKFGKTLIVYVPGGSEEAPAEMPTPAPVEPPASGPEDFAYYTIQRGDGLNRIAGRFGISLNSLMEMNGLTDPNKILAGQRIRVPKLPEVPASETSPAPEAEAAEVSAEPAEAP